MVFYIITGLVFILFLLAIFKGVKNALDLKSGKTTHSQLLKSTFPKALFLLFIVVLLSGITFAIGNKFLGGPGSFKAISSVRKYLNETYGRQKHYSIRTRKAIITSTDPEAGYYEISYTYGINSGKLYAFYSNYSENSFFTITPVQ